MGAVLSDEEFGGLFDTARHSARRLENRDRYDVPAERERERLFLRGQLTEERTRGDASSGNERFAMAQHVVTHSNGCGWCRSS